jgi:hypothetical protein
MVKALVVMHALEPFGRSAGSLAVVPLDGEHLHVVSLGDADHAALPTWALTLPAVLDSIANLEALDRHLPHLQARA